MIRTSDFTYDEVVRFIKGEMDFYALVLIEKRTDLWGDIEIKKSINFRKIEEIDGNKIKLYGMKEPLVNGEVSISIGSKTIQYKLFEITDEVVEIIREYMKDLGKKEFSSTKLNNYLWKKSPLKRYCEVVNPKIEELESEKDEEDDEFPF
jgi:hypothetical protein